MLSFFSGSFRVLLEFFQDFFIYWNAPLKMRGERQAAASFIPAPKRIG